jgi:RNA-directed DNA polymerase
MISNPVLVALLEPWRHYRRVSIPKNDGASRGLYIPSAELKQLQRKILDEDLQRLPKSVADHCCTGRSVLTNARIHLSRRYVSSYDIAQAFPSVTPTMVHVALKGFGVATDRAAEITRLTTYRGQLPQGAPTSSALLGAVLYPLDARLLSAAKRHGITYTRYADDLFISGNRAISFFETELVSLLADAGFQLAHSKTVHWTPRRRPKLLGVVIATTPTVDPEYSRSLSRLIHSIASGMLKANDTELASLRGKIKWVERLRPVAGRNLRASLDAALMHASRPA